MSIDVINNILGFCTVVGIDVIMAMIMYAMFSIVDFFKRLLSDF